MKPNNLVEMLCQSVERYPDKAAFLWKKTDCYEPITYRQFWEEIRLVASGLAHLGIGRDDKVAILSENNPKWAVFDFAICSLGAVTVPIYPTLPAGQVGWILRQSDCKAIAVQNGKQLAKVTEAGADILAIIMQPDETDEKSGMSLTLKKLTNLGREHPLPDWEQTWRQLKRSDLATIIHTSGTTGEPKGVMLTHGNFLSNIEGVQFWCLEARADDRLLSYLPLSHVFERMAGHFMPLSVGATIAYAESIEKIPENLLEIKPTVMTSVPLLFEKVYARIQSQILAGTSLRRKIANWAVNVGLKRYDYYSQMPLDQLLLHQWPLKLRWQWNIAERLVFRKIKAAFGGRLRGLISGGAPLNPEIARFFWAVNIPVLEGYGLTETSPVISANPMARVKIGTVGKPLPNLEVKIAADGEILVRGPNVMQGYYQNEGATAAQLSGEWLHTGDLGELDEEGYLRVIDRKKRLLILTTGKNVAPQPVENAINQSRYIEQSVLVGHRRKYVTALIVPDFQVLSEWAGQNRLPAGPASRLIRQPPVKNLIRSEIKQAISPFPPHEQPKKAIILSREWTIEAEELTPTLKVRAKRVEEKYEALLDQLYGDTGVSEWNLDKDEAAVAIEIQKKGEEKR
ncbi:MULTISPECIES: long-chain fatty acid--CoA ligase [unclassified Thermoactinomyces]|uniref:AMP-dependent synthetase/ligase n=1 Tax=unclassified Thermoactinomyces TaxID=2634588 RepID=UPI0018DDC38C|nr:MULTISPECIES: long-chain fatty acid--CoA ligase [unclassified Thermoactinomyces]MBH8596575.1 long-chain fatty acid--CoA ligase [Thermoactinomyces sp. CICC 10523]MBH8603337.1 long-chain fatty acid--CoA ligase [Thermoactinomyces sp. CICC 10522]MBH8607896.1 long-chain fatty acid--CoA ligase [Thermoactinomyces sp. CICC 10521]